MLGVPGGMQEAPGDVVSLGAVDCDVHPRSRQRAGLATGRSYCDPARMRVRSFEVRVVHGATLAEGPYRVETFDVSIRDQYVVLTI